MRRGVISAAALIALVAFAPRARGDGLDRPVEELGHADSYKVRLAAAITLSKSHDARAVDALATALIRDDEATIRRVCAIALGKIVDEETPKSSRELAARALAHAKTDRDPKVRDAAGKALDRINDLEQATAGGGGPTVFVNVGGATDLTHKGPRDLEKKLAGTVRDVVKHDYAVDWPGSGGLPTHGDLAKSGTHAFYVGATVAILDIAHKGGHAEIACTVSIRVAPWDGTDGAEKWEASKAASASGSGKATTGGSDSAVADGIRDCVLAVAEEVTARKVVPFVKQLLDH